MQVTVGAMVLARRIVRIVIDNKNTPKKIIATLSNMLVRPKTETETIPRLPKLNGLFKCNNCVYYKAGYSTPCSSFSFKLTYGKTISMTYKNYFSCDSKYFIYILICKTWDHFYLGQT